MQNNRRIGLLVAPLLFTGGQVAMTAPAPNVSLPLEEAQAIADKALRHAKTVKRDVAVAIVNREGRPILAMRMDGASYMNLDVAEAKAATAAALGIPTLLLEDQVNGGKPSLLGVREAMPIGGGLPILRDGISVGGVAVSGGSPEEDSSIAAAALSQP